MTGSINQIFNQKVYYEIRLESIGGLGANLCGKMIGELAVRYLNLNSAGFSSYGSEKTGTPRERVYPFLPPGAGDSGTLARRQPRSARHISSGADAR